jgi:hypothetical protein
MNDFLRGTLLVIFAFWAVGGLFYGWSFLDKYAAKILMITADKILKKIAGI